jgi:hypothetical protein
MSRISTYEQLVAERMRIEQELAIQKDHINDEISELKDKLKPITGLLSVFSGNKNPSLKSTAMQLGANIGIDVLLRNTLLGRAGWLARLVVPFLAKKISSKVIDKTVD